MGVVFSAQRSINRFIGQGNILVHCLDGLDLSPAVAIGILMMEKSLNFNAAYLQVKMVKTNVKI